VTILNIEKLAVNRGRQAVLHDVSLRLDVPGLYGLIGPNGGGKSTLLSVISGLLPATSGKVDVLGTTPRKAGPRLGLVPQAAGCDRQFPTTLRGLVETALLGPGLFARPPSDGADRVTKALTDTGTTALASRSLSALSGGGNCKEH